MERGNYPSFIYIKVSRSRAAIASLQRKANSILKNITSTSQSTFHSSSFPLSPSLLSPGATTPAVPLSAPPHSDVNVSVECLPPNEKRSLGIIGHHISLSKEFDLRSHQIDNYISSLSQSVTCYAPFNLLLRCDKLSLFNSSNDTSMSFVALDVDVSSIQSWIDPLVESIDKVQERFGLPKYYQPRLPHLSLLRLVYSLGAPSCTREDGGRGSSVLGQLKDSNRDDSKDDLGHVFMKEKERIEKSLLEERRDDDNIGDEGDVVIHVKSLSLIIGKCIIRIPLLGANVAGRRERGGMKDWVAPNLAKVLEKQICETEEEDQESEEDQSDDE